MVLGLSLGMAAGAAAAAATGALLVRVTYGALNFDAVPLSGSPSVAYVTQAPPVFFSREPLQVALTLMWPAGIAALVYALLAAADARDDLGGLPVADRPSNAQPMEPEAPEAAVS
jgi:pseudouridine-5'-phosphate glycosidase